MGDAGDPAAPVDADAGRPRVSRPTPRVVRTASAVTDVALDRATGRIVELGSAARRDDPRHWRAFLACLLAIVATAIDPPILQATSSGVQGAIRLEPEVAAQLVGLYYIIQAGTMVAGGVLGDRFGMRRVMALGLSGMLVGSSIVALAPTLEVLVAGHMTLSLFTAVVVPLALANVMRTFGRGVLPVAIGLFLTVQLVAALSGPAMAQLLFGAFGFSATMAPAILATLLAMAALRRWLPESPQGERMRPVDAISLTLWSLGMLGLVYGLMAFAGGWGSNVEAAMLLGTLLLFWAMSRLARGATRVHLPRVPFRIVGVTLFVGTVLGLTQSGSLLQLSTFLKGVQSYGDLASGLALAPFAVATLVTSVAIGLLLARRARGSSIDLGLFRAPITVGMIVVGVSGILMAGLRQDTGYLLIGTSLALLGLGASLANVPRTDLLFRVVSPDRVGVAAGLNGSCFLLGEALGNISVTAMIAFTSAAMWQATLVETGMTPDGAAAAYEAAQRAGFLVTAHPFRDPSYLDVASRIPGWEAIFTDAFGAAMLVLATMAVIAAIVAVFGLRGSATGIDGPVVERQRMTAPG